MHNLNKFKIFTIMFICMFVFVVAAIYTNTKEASENKMNANQQNKQQKSDTISNNNTPVDNTQIEHLSMRVNELADRVNQITGNPEDLDNNRLKCNVQGVLDGDHIEELSPETSIQEAKINGRELVLICTF